MTRTERRILLVGEFGCGSIGNDGTLAVVVEALRREHPDRSLRVLARNSAEVERQLGVPGLDIYWRPIGGRIGTLFGRFADVVRYTAAVLWADFVVVPGTGVLEGDLNVSPFGTPYLVFVVALLAFLTRRPFALFCIGVSRQPDPWAERFLRWGGRLAKHRSFRDAGSAAEAMRVGGGRPTDLVATDAYFGSGQLNGRPATTDVGIGVMNYWGPDPYATSAAAATARSRYVRAMAELVAEVCRQGRSVRFFLGDAIDVGVIDEIFAEMDAMGADRKGVHLEDVGTLPAIVASMQHCEYVVSPRYHNVIAAALAGRPVFGLAYGPKMHELITNVGLPGCSMPMGGIDGADLTARCNELAARSGSAASSVVDHVSVLVSSARSALDELTRGIASGSFERTAPVNGKELVGP